MLATEELMNALTVKQFISYLEEHAEFEEDDSIYLDGHVVSAKIYMLHETKNLRKEFIITEDGRLFYWLSVLQKIELVDENTKTDEESENHYDGNIILSLK